MTHRNQHGYGPERLTHCPGSNQRPLSSWRDVGVCRGCGVRTWLHHNLVQPHQTAKRDMHELRIRGPRPASGRKW